MVVKNLGALTAQGTSTAALEVKPHTDGYTNQTISVMVTETGDATAATVDLEWSLDGTNWGVLDSHALAAGEITDGLAMYQVTSAPMVYIRATLSALTATVGSSIETTIMLGK